MYRLTAVLLTAYALAALWIVLRGVSIVLFDTSPSVGWHHRLATLCASIVTAALWPLMLLSAVGREMLVELLTWRRP